MKSPMQNDGNSNDDEDVKIILSSPSSSTSTQQLLDSSGNKIGEVELNTFENFAYPNESFSTIFDRVLWGEHDTNFLLEKYELYIPEVGPRKRFHSKKYMWNQIANDIYAKFKLIITGAQCENRYKTVCKKRKQLVDNNLKSVNSKTVEEEKNATSTTTTSEESPENDSVGGLQTHFERLEQSNHDLTQQIEQCSQRVLTMVERLEKHHSRQQQKFDKSIQESKDQLKTDFSTMFEKLDKIHDTIQQNQEHQQKLLEKLIEDRREDHKTDFTTLLNVLNKIYETMKCDGPSKHEKNNHSLVIEKPEAKSRSRSRSRSRRKRRHSSSAKSRSNSRYNYKSPVPHSSKRSRSKERYGSRSRSSHTRTRQSSPHSSRLSKYDRTRRSKSRSPKHSDHRSCQDSSCKQRSSYR
ncbi:hypothetical protein Trydic_g22823 [Trypoxylus dichotomus]